MYGFSINLDKSVVLFRTVGKGAYRFTKCGWSAPKLVFFFIMPDSSIRLSMVSKTTYLGMIIIYRAWEMEHRPLKCVFFDPEEMAHSPMCSGRH